MNARDQLLHIGPHLYALLYPKGCFLLSRLFYGERASAFAF